MKISLRSAGMVLFCALAVLPQKALAQSGSVIRGYIDAVTETTATGWACSSGLSQSIELHMYVRDTAGAGTFIGSYLANRPSEPGVAAACGSSGTNHRFEIPIAPNTRRNYAGQKIWLHGISPVGGSNSAIGRSGDFAVLGLATVSATRRYVYDDNERLCKTINPESGATLIGYDAAGNIAWTAESTTLTTPVCDRGQVAEATKTIRGYDKLNRLRAVVTPDGSADATYERTPDGLISSASVNTYGTVAITTMTYNKRRLLVQETSGQSGWYTWPLTYTYNANGHLASQRTDATGLTVDYAPNALGQPTKAGSYASNVTYFPNGAMSGFTYGNGIVHSLTQNARQLPQRSRDVRPAGNVAVLDDTYAYDPNGNVSSIQDGVDGGAGNRWMTYDKLDRLTDTAAPNLWWTHAATTYDALDNIRSNQVGTRSRTYQYDRATNRLSHVTLTNADGSVVSSAISYDARGNTSSTGQNTFVFDAANRLTHVVGKESYRYDPQGRRVLSNAAAGNILFQYSQAGQLILTASHRNSENFDHIYLNGSLVGKRRHVYATGANIDSYVHTDALGSPVAESDSSGNVTRIERYTPYGEPTDGGYDQGPGFTGHTTDAGTKLTYMQQRYYDPQIGRFLSIDPVAADSGPNFNRYRYANDNPYLFTDPDGRLATTDKRGFINGNPDPNSYECIMNPNCRFALDGSTSKTPSVNPGKAAVIPGITVTGRKSGRNGVKTTVGILNVLNGGRLFWAGNLKVGAALLTSETFVGGVAFTVLASNNYRTGMLSIHRGLSQVQEGMQDGAGEGTARNLVGLLPGGEKFDDPGEPLMKDVYNRENMPGLVMEYIGEF